MNRNLLVRTVSVLLVAGLPMIPPPAEAAGVVWRDISLDDALAEAREKGLVVMIDLWAAHCGQCGEMDTGLWDTSEGAQLAEGTVPLKIDSTSPAGKDLNRRYPITGLPMVLFLRSDGTEIDRVVGYFSNHSFLPEATLIRDGYDALPDLEKGIAAHPDSLALLIPLMERYQYRSRAEDADRILNRILELDPENRYGQADKALVKAARYAKTVLQDIHASDKHWRTMLEKYPASSSIGAAIYETHKVAGTIGTVDAWKEWICGLVERRMTNGKFLNSVAMTVYRAGVRGECFGKAARAALELGAGGPGLDSIAVKLEGAPPPDR